MRYKGQIGHVKNAKDDTKETADDTKKQTLTAKERAVLNLLGRNPEVSRTVIGQLLSV